MNTEKPMMTNQEKDQKLLSTASDLIYLLSCAVHMNSPDPLRVSEMNLDAVYRLASYHQVVCPAALALESISVYHHDFDQDRKMTLRRLALFDIERAAILERFEKEGIWYLPLKGIIMKDCYPQWGMREMTDNDILCDPDKASDIKDMMESMGYECVSFGEFAHDVYLKAHLTEFEIHRVLFEENVQKVFYDYYADIMNLIQKDETNRFGYHFSTEEFYIYSLAHEYKHYSHGGIGLRALLDIYVFLKKYPDIPNHHMVEKKLRQLSLTEFEEMNRRLAFRLFEGDKLTEEETRLLLYFLRSGAAGTTLQAERNHVRARLEREDISHSKVKYFFSRLIIGGEELKSHYPFFYRHKWMLPALYIYRPVKGILTHPRQLIREIVNVNQAEKKH